MFFNQTSKAAGAIRTAFIAGIQTGNGLPQVGLRQSTMLSATGNTFPWKMATTPMGSTQIVNQNRTYLKHTWKTLVHTKGNSEFPSVPVHGNRVSMAYAQLNRRLVQSKIPFIFERQKFYERPTVRRRRKTKEHIARLFKKKLEIKLHQSTKYDDKLEQEMRNYDGI